ncbi:unnamed protein product, partial [Prunus brigantina]
SLHFSLKFFCFSSFQWRPPHPPLRLMFSPSPISLLLSPPNSRKPITFFGKVKFNPILLGKIFGDSSMVLTHALLLFSLPPQKKLLTLLRTSCILRSTLTEPVLAQVVGLTTSQAVWDCLRQNFSQQSLANATHLKFQLLTITKGTKTVSEYLALAKSLSDQLAAIRAPVSSDDLVSYVIRGLGPDYTMLITAIMQFPPLPTFADLRARLLAFDAQQSLTTLMASPPPPQAFYSAHSQPSRSGHPRGSRGVRHGSQFHRSGPSSSASTRPTFSGSSQPH